MGCSTMGRGCTTALPETTPTVPPTPPPSTPPPTPPPTQPPTNPPAPSGPVDPFNCAVDPENTWQADKKEWCCRIHHVGCPSTAPPPQPIIPPAPMPIAPPADPYNCLERTPDKGEDPGSNPGWPTRGYSSVGRALLLQGRCQRFKSAYLQNIEKERNKT